VLKNYLAREGQREYIPLNSGRAVEVYRRCLGVLNSFLNLALIVGELSALRPGRFYPKEIPHIRYIRGWVGHKMCFTLRRKAKSLAPEGN
jgi:hypothetical protein